jgi:ArsR family transcriptional regulator
MLRNSQDQIEEHAKIHQVLGNPSRLCILCALAEHEMSVGDIAEQIGATLQNTSQHLRLMKDKGVVDARRDGQSIFYRIARSETGENCKQMLAILNQEPQ